MTKVHPNAAAAPGSSAQKPPVSSSVSVSVPAAVEASTVLTVWRRSLLLDGNGFTVFDAKGSLVFRVDNYAAERCKGEIVLMDAAGEPLLTIRRKKLSLAEQWLIYDGEDSSKPRLSVKKHVTLLPSDSLAHVTPCTCAADADADASYHVEGSYWRRSCAVYDGARHRLAVLRSKEAAVGGAASFGFDVFRLVVEPGFDAAVAMAIVILLEQMFGSRNSLFLIKG
ncbi:Protein LURP-one-related 8 [Ananas comosus]|uniref:Protein LURP-one-related 8 n=1 Tax=Ananas comosus TaxID=4615 RepID=A0A199VDY4_ANACO|nr:Protein LURP-one-related 8 [Ananas comosus]